MTSVYLYNIISWAQEFRHEEYWEHSEKYSTRQFAAVTKCKRKFWQSEIENGKEQELA